MVFVTGDRKHRPRSRSEYTHQLSTPDRLSIAIRVGRWVSVSIMLYVDPAAVYFCCGAGPPAVSPGREPSALDERNIDGRST